VREKGDRKTEKNEKKKSERSYHWCELNWRLAETSRGPQTLKERE
jgi:hypothetical protein